MQGSNPAARPSQPVMLSARKQVNAGQNGAEPLDKGEANIKRA
jgi:hypothetical protein